ncbi:hypothetical protein SADUNF_Sadunf01G0138800 [Salix dunnii]|uniref:Uncharacterized protein n=1 Tax=Salix dunnii TaxID=1413687 RepID=A0A835NC79_9ROSI|nr:hypothetical protein SADUNF_Sadunf01G0138800 [Salix dunnii]
MADQHDDLEQLLDSAVDDFQILNLAYASQRSGDGDEESRKQNEKDKEKRNCLPSLPTGVRGLGMGLPDLKSKKKREKKVSKESHVEEALDKLREQTREAVKGLESVTAASKPDDSTKDAFTDDWVKQFEELAGSQVYHFAFSFLFFLFAFNGVFPWRITFSSLSSIRFYNVVLNIGKILFGGSSSWLPSLSGYPLLISLLIVVFPVMKIVDLVQRAFETDMESIVETMMQQLLSKEILYEPMKEIGERYPKWLEEHKASLNKEDLERYSHQYELIKDLNDVYESDPSNYNKIFDLMQKMQECGQPPDDIVQELAPDIDFANLGQMYQRAELEWDFRSPEMLEAQGNCCIM